MNASPLRVMHLTEGFDGGVVTFLQQVLPAQRDRGLDVSLACSPRHLEYQSADLEDLAAAGVRVRLVSMSRGVNPYRDGLGLASLVRLLRREPCDVLHTHCFKAGVLGRIAARITRIPIVVHTPHCFPFLRSSTRATAWASRVAERVAERWSDGIMLVSESQREAAIAAGIGIRAPLRVIPNALRMRELPVETPHSSLRSELKIGPDAPVVGTLSRLVSYKCVDHLVEAASFVLREMPESVFVVVGDGPEYQRLVRVVHQLRVSENVHFLGHRREARLLLREFNALALCSQAEGMPYAILEAARAGVPVVAAAVPGVVDLVQHEQSGLLYEWGRIDQLSAALVRCLSHSALSRDLADRARRNLLLRQGGYDIDRQVDEIIRFYACLLEASRRRVNCPAYIPSRVRQQEEAT